MNRAPFLAGALALLLGSGCGSDVPPTADAGVDRATQPDAKLLDAKLLDAKLLDAKLLDARLPDAKLLDARLPDTKVSTDPFDPASCTGSPMTQAEAVKLFAAGATTLDLATYSMQARTRDCNAVTGCAAWQSYTFASPGWPSLAVPMTGTVQLKVQGTKIELRLRTAICAAGRVNAGFEYGSACGHTGDATQTCTGYFHISSVQWGGSGGYYCNEGHGLLVGEPMIFTGLLTKSCLRLFLHNKSTTYQKEGQAAILVTF